MALLAAEQNAEAEAACIGAEAGKEIARNPDAGQEAGRGGASGREAGRAGRRDGAHRGRELALGGRRGDRAGEVAARGAAHDPGRDGQACREDQWNPDQPNRRAGPQRDGFLELGRGADNQIIRAVHRLGQPCRTEEATISRRFRHGRVELGTGGGRTGCSAPLRWSTGGGAFQLVVVGEEDRPAGLPALPRTRSLHQPADPDQGRRTLLDRYPRWARVEMTRARGLRRSA